MSDSDDTDVLLLIPPDLFLVPSSSDSDVSARGYEKVDHSNGRRGVISELVSHMQSLESRISAIESKDNSLDISILNNSLDSQIQDNGCFYHKQSGRSNFSVSQPSSLQTSPIKPYKSSSVPSTPTRYVSSNRINSKQNDIRSNHYILETNNTNPVNTNACNHEKHEVLKSHSDSLEVPSVFYHPGIPHVAGNSTIRESCSVSNDNNGANNMYNKACDKSYLVPSTSNLLSTLGQRVVDSKNIVNMEISEVDELIQEMEATDLELSKRINGATSYQCNQKKVDSFLQKQTSQGPNETDPTPMVSKNRGIHAYTDISLTTCPSGLFQLDETDKLISDFKQWEERVRQTVADKSHNIQNTNDKATNNIEQIHNKKTSDFVASMPESNQIRFKRSEIGGTNAKEIQENVTSVLENSEGIHSSNGQNKYTVAPEITETRSELLTNICTKSLYTSSLQDIVKDTEPSLRPQKLLSLSDFWDTNTNKSQGEMIRIKLEEEKFRREHCEILIQELQKRLLEHQEKLAVAVRVDYEKDVLISQFNNAWSKIKQRVQILEKEREDLEKNLKNINDKHQAEINEFQSQIKRCEGELSKALDLAAGYKEKSDSLMKEKIDLLKVHADELENSKLLIQEAENRYQQIKGEYNKLIETNHQTEESLKNIQQELNRERLRGTEVKNEMSVIHKALDTCEAELTVLKQEKENLQLKIKEEINRNNILEQKNVFLFNSLDDAKKAERLAKEEKKSLEEQQVKIRSELQEVYQKQVDEVVKAKLQEFQTQLDSAELEFVEELKSRQQVIAECAARKIKEIIDKHRLEINLLEEKHKEEKRLCELQLAQAVQKSSLLEMHLNSQRANKSQLAEQLHSVMQKQWQQALHIISGGNIENLSPLERLTAEKFFESKIPKESVSNCQIKISQEPSMIPTSSRMQTIQNDHNRNENLVDIPLSSKKDSKEDLRKYIKLIAEMQEPKEEYTNFFEHISSPQICREVPRKHYTKKELSMTNEDSILLQATSEGSAHDCSEYIPVPQKFNSKTDQQRNKPPWK
ncbi:centrosomal protein of 112 kDa isoform X1 [Vespula maculifrons]|uniref:Centrosomal protein of 112 kDa isoform X1 n=1 Tax=Vespula maculifrons TaxID=7453 RepID=A0ABD2D125_VESMC